MRPAEAPTVFVVDDDPSVRASIQGLLRSASLRSESFGTAEEFLRSKRSEGPSCLVLDVSLPGVNGLDFQRQLADAGIQIPIIFVTGHGNIPMTVKAMKSGAVEFHSLHCHRNISVTGDKDNGDLDSRISQLALKVQAVDARKAHVQNKAARAF